jgi:hypothetical protein
MRQAAVQANDPVQMQLANSQVLVDTLFGDPAIQQAKAMEEVIADAMSLEAEEDEDQFDLQIRQQKAILDKAASLDPEVAIQANQNMLNLMKDKKAQMRLDVKDAREESLFKRQENKYKAERTPIIERLDERTGQWEIVATGDYIEDPRENAAGVQAYAEQVKNMNADPEDGAQYRINNLASQYDLESKKDTITLASGLELTKPELRSIRNEYKNASEVATSMVPLLKLLAESPQALQGVTMNPDGSLEQGPANNFFQAMFNFGEEVRQGLAVAERDTFFDEATGKTVDVYKHLQEAGINSEVAQGHVVALAYAIAKARDGNGRLSDQDVSLAMKSLTGRGGIRQIAALLGNTIQQQKNKIKANEMLTGGNISGVVAPSMQAHLKEQFANVDSYLEALNKVADERGLAPVAGTGRSVGGSVDMGGGWTYTIKGTN